MDPCTPPKDGEMPAGRMSAAPANAAISADADGDATELDRMLVAADEDNYLKRQQEATPAAGARRMTYLCLFVLLCSLTLTPLRDVVNIVTL